jgi:serine/threonine protein phosphatase PrpC
MNLVNNNNNGMNLVNNNNANNLGNNQTIEDIINQINRETLNNNKENNYFIGDTNNTNNINIQMKGIPIQNNKNNMNNINNRINQPNNNQRISNQIVNKTNENQLINNQINNYLNQGLNYTNDNQYISPSASIIPSQAQKLQNEFTTTNNQAFNTNNLNGYDNISDLININSTNNINDLNDNLNLLNNFGNNINPFNQIQNNNLDSNQIKGYNQTESERLTIANEKPINDISSQPNIKGNDVKVTYNDFDGSGYVKNYGGVSRPGKDSSGNRKINQDSLVCLTHINNVKDFNIFGVLDGHGPEGHFISHFAADFIPAQMANNPEIKALTDPEKIYKKFKENNCRIITQAYVAADNKLKTMDFDSSESGSTCCLIIHIGKHIICANTGDSRALVAFDESGDMNSKNLNYLKAVPLSIDYKPELPEESNRIMMAGGVVEQMKDDFGQPVGPYRVWARGKDYPGLAMSRSIGDLKGKTLGVIPDPGILEYDLNKSTKFVLACSDGVWEFLNNDTVRDIGKSFYMENNASAYCHELIEQSLLEWTKNDIIVDDITAVVAFF